MQDALQFVGVSKRFGATQALDRVTFRVPRGSITGFVGHNGAGKTTAFSIVSGFLAPDAGEVDVLGRGPFDPLAMKGLVGVLPQDAELPDRHTPTELLYHLARLQGLGRSAASAEVERVIDVVDLRARARVSIATLSHGMRRRVAVATALLGSPPLVLLDEPLSGLDPAQQRHLREALAKLRGRQTLVLSSHDLPDLERLSDWVIMLKGGRCLREGALSEVVGSHSTARWEVGPGAVPLDVLCAAVPNHTFAMEGQALLESASTDGDLDASSVAVMRTLADAGVPLRHVRRGVGLEQRFLDDVARDTGGTDER
jgi:ABC-2 type transport system ATP-binding protein